MIDAHRWPKAAFSLSNLRGRFVEPPYLNELHGIEWPISDAFGRDFGRFLENRKGLRPATDKVDRYAFEMFLQSQRLASRNEMAAALGMRAESLDALLPRLPEIGLSKRYDVYGRGHIIDRSLDDGLIQTLDDLRFRTFGSHDGFCKALHDRLRKALDVEIEELFCKTAERLGDQRRYASTWDDVNIEPLSVGHDVLLDFGKPIMLGLDRCSKQFYAENQEEMREYLAGEVEPTDLGAYLKPAGRSA